MLPGFGLSGTQVLLYFGLFLLTLFWLIGFSKRRQKFSLLARIPGPPGNRFIGNGLDVIAPPREIFTLRAGKFCDYGRYISKVWMFNRPIIYIHKAEGAEVLLSSQTHITKAHTYDYLMPWLKTGLLTSTDKKWHDRRKMLTPTFHFKILGDFVEVFGIKAEKLVAKFQKHENGDAFNIYDYVTHCTLDIILESAMGMSINIQDNPELEYIKAVHTMGEVVLNKSVNPFLGNSIIFKLLGYKKMEADALNVLHGFTKSAIKTRKAERGEKNGLSHRVDSIPDRKRRLAFLDLLLEKAEEDRALTDEDIQEEVDTFVFEGHDTTSAGITFAIYALGCYPEIQKMVHEELDSIFGDSDHPATMEDLKHMKYLECCIKEALRIYPPVPFFGRTNKEPITIDGYKIPEGTTLTVAAFRIHRDPKYFPEPEKFIPERFLPENTAGRHPYAYIPFSAGPRNCIGQKFALMEEKAVISSIFRRFRVESIDKPSAVKLLGLLVLRPEEGIKVKIFSRM